MNDKISRNAAAMTGSRPEAGRNPDVENIITPPVDSGPLITGVERAPTALPGGGGPPPPPPQLELDIRINSPVEGDHVVGPKAGVPILVNGDWSANESGDIQIVESNVEVTLDGAPPEAAEMEFGDWSFSGNTPVGGNLTIGAVIYVTYKIGSGGVPHKSRAGTSVTVLANTTLPNLVITFPQNGQEFAGGEQGYLLTTTGTTSKTFFDVKTVHWSGDWSVSGMPHAGSAVSSDGWATWSAAIQVPPGFHTITFTCEDIGGNERSIAWRVKIALPSDIFGTEQPDYLKALIEFATQKANLDDSSRVVVGALGQPRNLQIADLIQELYQPFPDLWDATNTRKATDQVHQVRLVIEVLQRYLLAHPVSDPQAAAALASAQNKYHLAAYTILLNQIGTSYDEIRRARSADSTQRQSLAGRLGIKLGDTRPDNLDTLFLIPASITEQKLEQVFGLVDTLRNPLCDGAKLSDDLKAISQWNFEGVEPARNTDPDGVVYVSVQKTQPPNQTVQIKVYRDAGRTKLVASGQGSGQEVMPILLSEQNNSGLSGRLVVNYTVDTSNISISAAPSLLAWQLTHLRAQWEEQDYPTDALAGAPPSIDPDYLIDSDFKHRNPSDAAYLIYVVRQSIVANWISTLKQQREAASSNAVGFDAILQTALGKTLADLQDLDQKRQQGNDITSQLAALGLSLNAFRYLLHIGTLVQKSLLILDLEWDEVYAILVQVQKQSKFADWRTEERSAQITQSPDWFVISASNSTAPPQLPPWRATASARQSWQDTLQSRIDQQQSVIQALQSVIDATEETTLPQLLQGLIDAMRYVYPIPSLYGTGLGADKSSLKNGDIDPHWRIIETPNGPTTAKAYATDDQQSWVIRNNLWLANSNTSRWISPQATEDTGDAPGQYVYRTIFDLNGFDPATAQLTVRVAVDDALSDVKLNSQSLAVSLSGYSAFSTFQINTGLVPSINILDFFMTNGGAATNPSGLRIEFDSTAVFHPNVDWFTKRLLIDAGASSDRKSTRLSQAIETMQGLFFTLRSEGFQQFPDLASWRLNEPSSDFDQEWAYMGSHSGWRAAMLVFLFPQNILLPSLREGSTYAPSTASFQDMVESVRVNGPLTPGQARQRAKDYLNDIRQKLSDLPPELKNPSISLTDQLSDQDLTTRADQIRQWWDKYKQDPKALNYLAEIFYFVPLHLALQLQQGGQFTAALDWYRTVYAYHRSIDRRKIYYGLVAEEQIQTKYEQTPRWLVDSSLNPHDIATKRALAYTRFTVTSLVRCVLDFADSEFAADSAESLLRARELYLEGLELLGVPELGVQPGDEKVPANQVLIALRQHAELSLFKLRSGRNITGALRPYSEATVSPQPTQYRYPTLIERAKQLVSLAQQVEASFLASLERTDAEAYTILKARQDLGLAQAQVTLAGLRVTEAFDGTTLAYDQKVRAENQRDHYQDLLNAPISEHEQDALNEQLAAFRWTIAAGVGSSIQGAAQGAAQGAQIGMAAGPWGVVVGAIVGGIAGGFTPTAQTVAGSESIHAQFRTMQASFERRQQEWQFQHDLAEKDVQIGSDQVKIANDHQAVATQEQTIASMQADHAQAVVDFLATKFTNVQLYEWMSGVLQGVYSYFLRQGTAMARLAQGQLAFERQERPLGIIQADYWQAPSDTTAGSGSGAATQSPDRRGLTGSARLLEDIYQLDQYAFETNRRKLQLTKTISLAQVDPFALQRFRESGVLPIATPMGLFDRDFPGHYLRLIKRVRTSVIALIPPTQGIRATLSNAGISRVTIGGDLFQHAVVRRDPQSVALTSPVNATGLFELDTQPELLLPFEGLGVDTFWEFRMPMAANPFDYSTIADVLITIEYTALNSDVYSQQVIQQMARRISGDRGFSFRLQFADAWYELHNPDQATPPAMTVTFETRREDFPPNITDLKIQHLLLYFACSDGNAFDGKVVTLKFKAKGEANAVGGVAIPTEGVISTRRGNAENWKAMTDESPTGVWTLSLQDTPEIRHLFDDEMIEDILFVITYSGRTPEWPA